MDQPKAFAKLGEDPLLAEPLHRLDECEWVDAIVLVAPPGWEEPAILLAEVVRNLSLRDHEKGLSTGEKQMFVKAKKILASELMYAKGMDEDECAEWLDGVLTGSGNGKKQATAAKKKAVAATV